MLVWYVSGSDFTGALYVVRVPVIVGLTFWYMLTQVPRPLRRVLLNVI